MMTDILIGLGIVGVIGVWLTVAYARDHVQRHGLHKITGRALTGRRTDGARFANSSFWRKSDGKVKGHPVGRVSAREHRAGAANVARLIGWITAIGLAGYGLMNSRKLTIILAAIAITSYLSYKAFRLVIRLRIWYVNRTVVGPMAEALGPLLELTGPEMETSIQLKPNYLTLKSGELGRIALPPRFANFPSQQDAITHVITSRLPIGADVIPHMSGRAPYLALRAAPALPSMVKFSDYVGEIEKLEKSQYLAGIDRNGEGYIAKFVGPEPHHGMAWATSTGKSTQLKSILAQVKHNEPNSGATIIDPKEISLDALKGIPGFDFYDDASEFDMRIPGLTIDTWQDAMPGMFKGIKSVYDLMIYRFQEMKRDPTIEFPTHLFIAEEMNSFSLMAKAWFQRNRPKGIQGANPPIWADWIAPLFWRARQANIFIVLVAQNINDRYLGGMSLRPSLGLISLAKYRPNQYASYIGTSPIPKVQKGQGRALYNDSETDTWLQCLYGSDHELREFALANIRKVGETIDIPKQRESTTLILPKNSYTIS